MSTQKELDLVFCCDCTGSMGSYLQAAKDNIQKIVEEIVMMEKCDVQFALIEYRDHPPQDATFAVRVNPFTSSVSKMRSFVDNMQAAGGGDGPESVADALWEALNMDYRKQAAKVVCCISDAPPHGLGEDGDGFPNGCPCNHDPIESAKKMAEKGIIIFAIGVEPTLSSFKFARDFMRAISKITEGQFLPLSSANLLAKVIVGAAIEEMSLQVLMQDMEKDVIEMRKEGNVKEEEIVKKVSEKMKARKVETNKLKIDSLYSSPLESTNMDVLVESKSLAENRSKLKPSSVTVTTKASAPSPMSSVAPPPAAAPARRRSFLGGLFGFGSSAAPAPPPEASGESYSAPMPVTEKEQTAEYEKSEISEEQVSKMYSRAKKQNLL